MANQNLNNAAYMNFIEHLNEILSDYQINELKLT